MYTQIRGKGVNIWQMLYRYSWVLLLWYNDETDRIHSIQERELKDCEFARCKENEHDSLESMMSFITNRCWVLVHVLEFYACMWWFWHKKLLLSLTFHHNPHLQNTECALRSLDPMTCLKVRHSSCSPSDYGEMHSFSILGMLPTLHFLHLNVSQINHICRIIGGSCGYQIFVLDLMCSLSIMFVSSPQSSPQMQACLVTRCCQESRPCSFTSWKEWTGTSVPL